MHSAEALDFSIIVPTRNRPRQLAACLEAIANLDFPRSRYEVVVVDDGGSESLEPVVAPHRPRLQVTLHAQSRGGPALARNQGALIARGRFLAFTDDDCAPSPAWLGQLAACFGNSPGHVISGRTVNALSANVFATTSQLLIDYLYHYFNATSNKIWFLASSNMAIPAEIYRSVGGFDPAFPLAAAEDRDFCDRLRHGGYSMTYAAGAIVYHSHSLRLSTFWRQHFGYGRGAHRFHQAHRQRSGESIPVEPLPFYAGMVSFPFRRQGTRWPICVSALLFLSQVANTAGFFREWAQRNGERRETPRQLPDSPE